MELDNQEIILRFPADVRDFCVSKAARPAVDSKQSLTQCATGVLAPGVKRPGRELDLSLPPSAAWSYTVTPPYAFMAWKGTSVPLQK